MESSSSRQSSSELVESGLTPDVTRLILVRLRSKELLRCSVTRSLKSRIDDDYSFLNRQMEFVSKDHLLFTCWCPKEAVQLFFSASTEDSGENFFNADGNDDDSDDDLEDSDDDIPIVESRFLLELAVDINCYYKLVSTIHGLIMIEKVFLDYGPTERCIFLLNPGLVVSKTIPNLPIPSSNHLFDLSSHFGFEPVSKTYKILGIMWDLGEMGDEDVRFTERRPIGCDFKMYGMGLQGEEVSQGWESIDLDIGDIPFDILSFRNKFKFEPNISVNGHLYWLMEQEETEKSFIAYFNLWSRSFGSVSLPTPSLEVLGSSLFDFEGNLGLMSGEGNLLWVFSLDENGSGSWRNIALELREFLAAHRVEPKGSTKSKHIFIPSQFIVDGICDGYWCIMKVCCQHKWRKWMKVALPHGLLDSKTDHQYESMLYQDILHRVNDA